MYYSFGKIDENRCPLYMAGNSTQEEKRIYLNEWGTEHNQEEGWCEEYDNEDETLFKGYDILNNEGKIKCLNNRTMLETI